MNYFSMDNLILTGIAIAWILGLIAYLEVRKDTALKSTHVLMILSLLLLPVAGIAFFMNMDLVSVVFIVLATVLLGISNRTIGKAGYGSRWLTILSVVLNVTSLILLISKQLDLKLPGFLGEEIQKVEKDFVIVEKPKPVAVVTPVQTTETAPTVCKPCSIQVSPKFDANELLKQMSKTTVPPPPPVPVFTSSKTVTISPPEPSLSFQERLQESIKKRSTPQVFSTDSIPSLVSGSF